MSSMPSGVGVVLEGHSVTQTGVVFVSGSGDYEYVVSVKWLPGYPYPPVQWLTSGTPTPGGGAYNPFVSVIFGNTKMSAGTVPVGGTHRFTVECYGTDGLLVAQDSEPTVVVVRNGVVQVGAVVAVVDRNGDDTQFDCSYAIGSAVEGDNLEFRVSVTIDTVTYKRPSEHVRVVAAGVGSRLTEIRLNSVASAKNTM